MVETITVDRSRTRALPAEVTSFVGRRHEIAEIKRLMSGSRAVTLVGVGGVGKTRLALRVAGEVRRAFPDGVCLVELAALEKPELLVQTVAEALEIRDRSMRNPLEMVIDHLRDKRTLVVLDNCEHLQRECAVVTEMLLRYAPGVQILATSRQALGLVGEQTIAVPTMTMPAGDTSGLSTKLLAEYDAVRLFADRADAVVPGFTVTETNRDVVEQICRRLDGIPLAIELAAVRMRALSLTELLDNLNDRFRLLSGGSPAMLPRQQTLRALIDWSYALCTEQERLLWARVSVFAGSLDLEAAEEVCSGDGISREEIIHVVIGLVDKSVLIREEHSSVVRYRLLGVIRQYGLDRLEEFEETTRLRRRHRDWYRDLAIRADGEWFGPSQVEWFQRVRAEHGNMRMALDYCLTSHGEAHAGAVIATSLRSYWLASGFLQEGRRWHDRLIAADIGSAPLRGHVLTLNARLAVMQSDFASAAAMLEESRKLAARAGDPLIPARIAFVAGLAALFQEDLTSAVEFLDEAVKRYRGIEDPVGEVNSLPYLATAHSFLGHSDEAVRLFEECLGLCEPRNEAWFKSCVLCIYGIEARKRGDVAAATEMERQSVRLKQPFNDRLGIALCTEVMTWIAADQGDFERAACLLGALPEVWRSVGGPLFRILAEYHDQCELITRRGLGEGRFDVCLREGAAMTLDVAVALAFRENAAEVNPSADGPEPSPLTRREMEIAHLVGRGMSNKQIAASLVIAQRTAEGHVERILNKLGFTSRTQIAVWARERSS